MGKKLLVLSLVLLVMALFAYGAIRLFIASLAPILATLTWLLGVTVSAIGILSLVAGWAFLWHLEDRRSR